jgi:ATP/maltotriose-dependent transcriptional regulator MalT
MHAQRLLESPLGGLTGGLAWADLGHCAIELGDFEIAREALLKGLNTPNTFSRIERPRHLAGAALLACNDADVGEALRLADEARKYAEDHQLRQHYPLTALVQGKVNAIAGQLETAMPAFEQAIQEATSMEMWPIAWQAHAETARTMLASGRTTEADQHQIAAQGVVNEIANKFEDPELKAAYLRSSRGRISGA